MAKNERDTTRGEERAGQGIVDVTAAIFADAVTDIRRRVIEQGWSGAPQDGPASKLAHVGAAPARDGFDPYDPWGWNKEPAEEAPGTPAVERAEKAEPEPDRGIDL